MTLVHVIIERAIDPSPAQQATVARALALRYQLPEADALKLLASGQRFRVRANADPADGERMVAELSALGVIAVLVQASGRPNTPLPPGAPAAPPASTAKWTPATKPPASPPPMPPMPPPGAPRSPRPPPPEARTMLGGMGNLPAPPAAAPAPPAPAPTRQVLAPVPIGATAAFEPIKDVPGVAPAPAAARPSFESGLGAVGAGAPPPPVQTFGLGAAVAVPPPVQTFGLAAAGNVPPPAHAYSSAVAAQPAPVVDGSSSFDRLGDAGGLSLSALDGSGDQEAGGPVDHMTGRTDEEQARMFLPPDAHEEGGLDLGLDSVAAAPPIGALAPAGGDATQGGASFSQAAAPAQRAATPTATMAPKAAAAEFAAFGDGDVLMPSQAARKQQSAATEAILAWFRANASGPVALFAIGIILSILIGVLPVLGYASGAEAEKLGTVVEEIENLQSGVLTLSQWEDLPLARSQAVERMGRARTSVVVMSVLMWAAIAGGLAYAWTRFVIPPLVRRFEQRPRGGG